MRVHSHLGQITHWFWHVSPNILICYVLSTSKGHTHFSDVWSPSGSNMLLYSGHHNHRRHSIGEVRCALLQMPRTIHLQLIWTINLLHHKSKKKQPTDFLMLNSLLFNCSGHIQFLRSVVAWWSALKWGDKKYIGKPINEHINFQ